MRFHGPPIAKSLFAEHTDVWVLRDIEPRRKLRAWLNKVLATD